MSGSQTPIQNAATLLLIRDGAGGLEVFMVKRHHEIDFAGGAMVFPGGKTDVSDAALVASGLCDGVTGLESEDAIARVTALREGFEESGFLLARDRAGRLLDAAALATVAPDREQIASGALELGALLRTHGLRLACDCLLPYAHWLGPAVAPRRFDTRFYLVEPPHDQSGSHDGLESVDSLWISPRAALQAAAQGQLSLVFPTRRNLERLAQHPSVAATRSALESQPVVKVEPFVTASGGEKYLCIREDAGYPVTSEPLSSALPRRSSRPPG
jgi:8-oxo-dGTP pyrophosphatase MutT (NUDIX family)